MQISIRLLCAAAFLAVFSISSSSLAAPLEVKIDTFESGQEAFFQSGFDSGEIGAVRLTTPPGGHQLLAVTLLFGPSPTSQEVTLNVWSDDGNVNPGTLLHRANYTLQGSANAFSSIDLSAESIVVDGKFRVGIEFLHDGDPSIARDDRPIGFVPTESFIYIDVFNYWTESSELGLIGEWIIRATINVADPLVDAGPAADAGELDAGELDAGEVDAGEVDAGEVDAGEVDAGELDAGEVDAGELDAGELDAGEVDAGEVDAGEVDAGEVDAGQVEDGGTDPEDAGEVDPETCALNSDCNNGSYCGDDGVCTQDCRIDTDCETGFTCDAIGRCVEEVEVEIPTGCGCDASGANSATELALLSLFTVGLLRRRRLRTK